MYEGRFTIYSYGWLPLGYSGKIFIEVYSDKSMNCVLTFDCPPMVYNLSVIERDQIHRNEFETDNLKIIFDSSSFSREENPENIAGTILIKGIGDGRFRIQERKHNTYAPNVKNDIKSLQEFDKKCVIL